MSDDAERPWTPDPPSLPPPPEEAPVRRRAPRAIVVAGAIAAVLVAGGASAAFLAMRGSSEELLTRLPASTGFVVAGYLDPSASQKANLFRMAGQFPSLGREGLSVQAGHAVDSLLAGTGLSRRDLDWIGVEVAFAGSLDKSGTARLGLLVDADDVDGAQRSLATMWERVGKDPDVSTYKGVDISVGPAPEALGGDQLATAVVDGVVVVANSRAFIEGVIDAAQGDTAVLADDPGFRTTTEPLPAGRLGIAYVNVSALLDAAGPDAPAEAGIEGFAVTASAEPDGLALDYNVSTDPEKFPPGLRSALEAPDHENPLLGAVPADAFGVTASEHLDASLGAALDQAEAADPGLAEQLGKLGITGPNGLLTSFDGDMALDVAPGKPTPGGVLILGSSDDAAMGRSLDTLANALLDQVGVFGMAGSPFTNPSISTDGVLLTDASFQRPHWKSSTYRGVRIRTLASAFAPPISYAVADGMGMVANTPGSIERAIDVERGTGDAITTDDAFAAALRRVPSSDGFTYLNVAAISDAIRDSLGPKERIAFALGVAPDLKAVRAVVTGWDIDEHRQHGRLFVHIP